MGTVYQAVDNESGHPVALKTLQSVGSDAAFRLKQEFRSLADLAHDNVVRLHELFVDGEDIFFSMELVSGTDVLSYVRDGTSPPPAAAGGQTGLACDESRLRAVLPQLAGGLAAIHAAGKVHRDIKPSNILVTAEGQVKILDFGLMIDIGANHADPGTGKAVGTPAYMSPEQAIADPHLGPASDWYSFGTIAFEALTGRLPFSGRPLQILLKKTQQVPAPPRQFVPEVPNDLDILV